MDKTCTLQASSTVLARLTEQRSHLAAGEVASCLLLGHAVPDRRRAAAAVVASPPLILKEKVLYNIGSNWRARRARNKLIKPFVTHTNREGRLRGDDPREFDEEKLDFYPRGSTLYNHW